MAQTEGEVLFIEPYYGGSHRQLVDLLVREFGGFLVTLPPTKWHWRTRVSALHFANTIPESDSPRRALFASSVLNLCELVALRPDLGRLHKVLYFHENQLVYPVRKQLERDFQYGYNQILSCLVADTILFNSHFNMTSFLDSIPSFLKLIPDHRPVGVVEKIRHRCKVVYFPLEPNLDGLIQTSERAKKTFNNGNTATSDGPILNTSDGPQLNNSDGPILNTSDGPQLNTSDGPQLNTSDGPQLNTSDGPQLNTSDGPILNTSDGPQLNTSDGPQLNTSDGPILNTSDGPQLNTSDGPQLNTSDGSQLNTSDGSQLNTCDGPQLNTSDGPQLNTCDGPQLNTSDGPCLNGSTSMVYWQPVNFRVMPCLHIVWPHRWEHDKGPDEFCSVLTKLCDAQLDFVVSILGSHTNDIPASFQATIPLLGSRVLHQGSVTQQDYWRILNRADVVVSTAKHEFFGVAMLEASYCGCYPLCPNRLVYPEIYPKECLYNTEQQLFKRLRAFCLRPALTRAKLQIQFDRFQWRTLKLQYQQELHI